MIQGVMANVRQVFFGCEKWTVGYYVFIRGRLLTIFLDGNLLHTKYNF